MNKIKGGKIFAALWLIIGYSAILIFLGAARNYIDSDMASEIMLSKLCASENGILSVNWYYSTELRLLNMQTVMIPLCKIFTDYMTIRLLSSAVIYALIIISYFYCCRQAGISDKALYFAPVFVTPFAYSYMKYDMIGLYYYVYSIVSFFSMGFLLKINNESVPAKKKILPWIFYVLFAALIGLTTIRQLILFYYPVSLVLFILWLNGYIKKFGTRVAGIKEIWNEIILKWREDRYLKHFITSCAGSFIASVGYVINVLVLRDIYNFHSYDRLLFTNIDDFDAFSEVIVGHIKIFGYTSDVQFISLNGIANVLSMFFIGCLIYILCIMIKKFDSYDIRCRIIIAYFICAVSFNAFVFIFSNLYGERYMLPYMLFFTVILTIYLSKTCVHHTVKKLFYVIFSVVFILNGVLQYRDLIEAEADDGRNRAAQFMVDKGYDFGYATFWNANVFTELTNGKVEIRNVHIQQWETLGYEHWLMEKKNENRLSDKPIFVLMDYEQYAANADLEFLQDEYRVYDSGGYMIFEYKNTEELYSMVKTEE